MDIREKLEETKEAALDEIQQHINDLEKEAMAANHLAVIGKACLRDGRWSENTHQFIITPQSFDEGRFWRGVRS